MPSIHFIFIVSPISNVLLSIMERLPRRLAMISLLARTNIAHQIQAPARSLLVSIWRFSSMRKLLMIHMRSMIMNFTVGRNFLINRWSLQNPYFISRIVRLTIFAIMAVIRSPRSVLYPLSMRVQVLGSSRNMFDSVTK